MKEKSVSVILLAGGQGKRMKVSVFGMKVSNFMLEF